MRELPTDPPENTQRPKVQNDDDQYDLWRDQKLGDEIQEREMKFFQGGPNSSVKLNIHDATHAQYRALTEIARVEKNNDTEWVDMTIGGIDICVFKPHGKEDPS